MKLYKNLGHGAPMSRRAMLARSALTVSAAATVPSLASMLLHANKAYGDVQCAGATAPGLIPFLVFDLNGGAALPGNFLVAKDQHASDLLSSYDVLGWNPRDTGALDTSFGLPMAAKASQLLVGLRQTASAAALAKLRFGSFCHISQDDSSVNRSSALTLVSAAGLGGSLINTGVGLSDSASGGNSSNAVDDPARKPLTISSLNDFLGAVSYGPALSAVPAKSLSAMADAILKLSAEQVRQLAGLGGADQLAALAGCGYSKNLSYASGPVAGIDPRQDPIFQNLYGISTSSDSTDSESIFAGVVMNVLRGNCGPGVLTIDGCDYHTGAQSDGDAKDLQIGQELGRAIEAANQLNKPLFIEILTDGGLSAAQGTRNWSGDAGDKGMTVIAYFNPKAAPSQLRLQVGAFTDGQSADRSSLVGSDPALAAYGVFANYLSAAGKLDSFNDLVPGRPFDDDALRSVLIFGS